MRVSTRQDRFCLVRYGRGISHFNSQVVFPKSSSNGRGAAPAGVSWSAVVNNRQWRSATARLVAGVGAGDRIRTGDSLLGRYLSLSAVCQLCVMGTIGGKTFQLCAGRPASAAQVNRQSEEPHCTPGLMPTVHKCSLSITNPDELVDNITTDGIDRVLKVVPPICVGRAHRGQRGLTVVA